ncbi:hypothetical protein ACPEEZ_12625 [Frigoribacterium sp. 2-23]|uniref:hypothetical protein n=1 Tax=Frigoribacterium sp. 2-23 TaxID=3415006 RepID=UPI003C6F9DEE
MDSTGRRGRHTTGAVVVAAAIALASAALLTSCTHSGGVIGERYDGAGPGTLGPDGSGDTGPTVGWVDEGSSFFVTTYGSSSCPAAPTGLSVDGDTLEVTMTQQGGDVCTADFGPSSYALELPSQVRAADPLAIRLLFENGDRSELTLER